MDYSQLGDGSRLWFYFYQFSFCFLIPLGFVLTAAADTGKGKARSCHHFPLQLFILCSSPTLSSLECVIIIWNRGIVWVGKGLKKIQFYGQGPFPISLVAPSPSKLALDTSIIILYYYITPNNKNSCPAEVPGHLPWVSLWSCRCWWLGNPGYRWDICRNSQEQGRLCPAGLQERGVLESLGYFCPYLQFLLFEAGQAPAGDNGNFWQQGMLNRALTGQTAALLLQPGAGCHRYYQDNSGLFFQFQPPFQTHKFSSNIGTSLLPGHKVSLADWDSQGGSISIPSPQACWEQPHGDLLTNLPSLIPDDPSPAKSPLHMKYLLLQMAKPEPEPTAG